MEDKDIIAVLDFMGSGDNPKEPSVFLQRSDLIEEIKEQKYIPINTLEGVENLFPTEILIRGVEGEYYPVKRANFDKVYEVIA